jgi:hypothetical protein
VKSRNRIRVFGFCGEFSTEIKLDKVRF